MSVQCLGKLFPDFIHDCRAFLLVFGLNGILGLILADNKTIEEMEMMASGAGMMGGAQQGAAKNYKALFKAEKDFYEILNYKFALDDVEDAFMHKFGKSA